MELLAWMAGVIDDASKGTNSVLNPVIGSVSWGFDPEWNITRWKCRCRTERDTVLPIAALAICDATRKGRLGFTETGARAVTMRVRRLVSSKMSCFP